MLSNAAANALLEDARGAARPRRLRPGHHRSAEGARHHPQPDPALRVPAARCRDPRRPCCVTSGTERASRSTTTRSRWPSAGAGARPATPSRPWTRWWRSGAADERPARRFDEVTRGPGRRRRRVRARRRGRAARGGLGPPAAGGGAGRRAAAGLPADPRPRISPRPPAPTGRGSRRRGSRWGSARWSGEWRRWAAPRSRCATLPMPGSFSRSPWCASSVPSSTSPRRRLSSGWPVSSAPSGRPRRRSRLDPPGTAPPAPSSTAPPGTAPPERPGEGRALGRRAAPLRPAGSGAAKGSGGARASDRRALGGRRCCRGATLPGPRQRRRGLGRPHPAWPAGPGQGALQRRAVRRGERAGRPTFALPNAAHRDRCEDVRPVVETALSEYFGTNRCRSGSWSRARRTPRTPVARP